MRPKSSPNTSYGKLLIAACFVLVAAAAAFGAIQYFFRVKTVQLVPENSNTMVLKMQGLEELHDYNLLLTPTETIISFLKISNPGVKNIQLAKVLPDILIVTVSYQTPAAYIKGDHGYFIISSDATILATTSQVPRNLTEIVYYQVLHTSTYPSGSKLDFKDMLTSLIFLQSSLDLGLKITKIEINGLNMIALYADKEKILFSQDKSSDLQKYQFETIIKQFRLENKSFKSLDVRFDKPIVIF